MKHDIKLNYITVTDIHGGNIFEFETIESYERWFAVTDELAFSGTDNLYTYYNVSIDDYGAYELTYSQLYDAQPIQLENGTELQLFDDYEL